MRAIRLKSPKTLLAHAILASFTVTFFFFQNSSIVCFLAQTEQDYSFRYSIMATKSKRGNQTSSRSLNILIALPVNCHIGFPDLVHSLRLPKQAPDCIPNKNVFWLINMYNKGDSNCLSAPHLTQASLEGEGNVKIVNEPVQKAKFWAKWIDPLILENAFGTRFNYVWLIDEDLGLNTFDFDMFVNIAHALDAGIVQPGILPLCPNCRSTNHNVLRQSSASDVSVVSKVVSNVELMAPMFQWHVWEAVHSKLKELVRDHNLFEHSDVGPDYWWCKVSQSVKGEKGVSCAVVHYTPIVHLDRSTLNRDDTFKNKGREEFLFQMVWAENFTLHESLSTSQSHKKEHYVNDAIFSDIFAVPGFNNT